mgnify:CR=1 FL=1
MVADRNGAEANAGLHHPLCSEQPFTYAADSPRGTLHGFLNVFVAAALLRAGRIDVRGATALLRERDPAAFAFATFRQAAFAEPKFLPGQ